MVRVWLATIDILSCNKPTAAGVVGLGSIHIR